MPKSDCTTAIEAFAAADPARFRPLPATCTLDDVKQTLRSRDASIGMLANRSAGVGIQYFTSDKLPEIHAWVDQNDRVVLLDADWPPTTAEAYLAALGEPDARLDYPWRGRELERAEHVWTTRGVVVVASASLAGVLRVGVFPPSSLADYEASYRYVDIDNVDEG